MKKVFTLTFFAAFLLFPAFNVLFGQCISGNCQNGSGIFVYPSGAKYIGQFIDGQIEGIGSCYYTDGSKYQGQWLRGRPHGNGIKILQNGTRIEGKWENGQLIPEKKAPQETAKTTTVVKEEKTQTGCVSGDCRNGKGIYIYPSGAIYIGEFKNGEIHGVGVCYYSDDRKYQGNWVHRYPEGKGTMTYPDNTSRTGNWKKGQPVDDNGQIIELSRANPIVKSDETDIQSGCVNGDCQNGKGTFAYPDGSRFEGNFRNGRPQGNGTFNYPNGEKYTGSFQNGVPHGKGQLAQSDGKTITGQWSEGEYIGTERLANNRKGCIDGDCQEGFGNYIFRDGAKYEGTFKNGLPHGTGKVLYRNSEKYEGEMAKGSFNGKGTLSLMDGTKVSGYWQDGVYLGPDDPANEEQVQLESPVIKSREQLPQLKVWAVIIGVATYNHMPVLRYTDDDAYRIYAFLKSPQGGALDDEQIRILIDEEATKDNITKTMDYIFSKAGKNDLVMLYFSGHGLKGSFLPYDYDGYNNRLLHEEINAILNKSDAKYKLCIADACHSGSLLAARSNKAPNLLNSYYETLAKAKEGTALIMSSKSDETSLESSGLRQGVFSHFLIRGLKGEADSDDNKVVNIKELFDFVDRNVRAYTGNRQSPLIQGDYDPTMTVAVKK